MEVPGALITRRIFMHKSLLTLVGAALSACRPRICRWTRINTSRKPKTNPRDRFWRNYKCAFLKPLPNNRGTILVDEGGDYTPSEGVGHACFFAVERKDWATLDSLIRGLSYFRKSNGLLRWRINPDGSVRKGTENCATETEQNIANALLLAYEKTGRLDYRQQAQALLDALWENATILFQGKRVLLPSDLTESPYWPLEFSTPGVPCQPTADGLKSRSVKRLIFSTSYFSPEHAVRFAKHDTNARHDWNRLVVDWYEIMHMVLNAATQEPKRFGIVDVNPMPDFVKLAPKGTNRIVVENFHPKLGTGEGEWSADIIRIPLYIGIHNAPQARAFLRQFFTVMRSRGFRGPDDVIVGKRAWWLSSLTTAAIGCYGVGLKALGEDATKYQNRLRMDRNGLFSAGFFQRPRYYRDTISYYAWLVLNGMFPH